MTRSSIATVTPEAGFSVGSYLASVSSQQSAVLNALLGTFGGTATVTLVGLSGLGQHHGDDQSTHHGLWRSLLTTSNVLTTSEPGSTVAVDLERRRGESGGPAQL